MACFAGISVSQGSVATYARCAGISNINLTTNLLRNLSLNLWTLSVSLFLSVTVRGCSEEESMSVFVFSSHFNFFCFVFGCGKLRWPPSAVGGM